MTLTPDISDALKERVGELRSKWGWFVGLGIADADRRRHRARQSARRDRRVGLSRRLHDADRRRLPDRACLRRQELGRLLPVAARRPALCGRRHHRVQQSVARFRRPDPASGSQPAGFRRRARLDRLQALVEQGLGLDHRGGVDHRARRPRHRDRLAGQQPVGARHVPVDRPDLPGLDRQSHLASR